MIKTRHRKGYQMHLAIIINSFVCVIGALLGAYVAAVSVVRMANSKVTLGGRLLKAAVLVPAAFMVSGFGAWLANEYGASEVAIGLIVLPWVYGLAFVGVILVALRAKSPKPPA